MTKRKIKTRIIKKRLNRYYKDYKKAYSFPGQIPTRYWMKKLKSHGLWLSVNRKDRDRFLGYIWSEQSVFKYSYLMFQ